MITDPGPIAPRFLDQDDRIAIGLHAGKNVKEIAATIGKSFQTVYREIKRNCSPPAPPHLVRTDATMVDHILRNLLSNALKYTQRGEVELTARPDGVWWSIAVRDTGIGIPDEHQRRIFEEFYQVPGALQARVRGSGLGLPYARRLAETLGGGLELSSEPGRGTTVTLRIPATVAEPLHLATVLLMVADDSLRSRLRHVLAGFTDVVLDAADLPAMTSPPDVVMVELDADPNDPPTGPSADRVFGAVPRVLLTWNDNDTAGQSGAALHRSRLSMDAVREAIRRAMGACPVSETGKA